MGRAREWGEGERRRKERERRERVEMECKKMEERRKGEDQEKRHQGGNIIGQDGTGSATGSGSATGRMKVIIDIGEQSPPVIAKKMESRRILAEIGECPVGYIVCVLCR